MRIFIDLWFTSSFIAKVASLYRLVNYDTCYELLFWLFFFSQPRYPLTLVSFGLVRVIGLGFRIASCIVGPFCQVKG